MLLFELKGFSGDAELISLEPAQQAVDSRYLAVDDHKESMISLKHTQAKLLTTDACTVIDRFHDACWKLITTRKVPRNQWEAWFVAHLCGSMCDVAKAWRPHIAKINPKLRLSVSSVFTHQSPYVKWSSGRCELADLMIAFVDRTTTPRSGYASLVQAKQADGNPVKLSTKSEKAQFHLLQTRPIFDVDATSAPTKVVLPKLRSSHDKAIFYGVNPPKNLAANPHPWPSHRWQMGGDCTTAPIPNQISVTSCLAETLVEYLQGMKGWDFVLPPPGKNWAYFAASPRDDWTMIINYLLEVTFAKPLKTFKTVIGQPDRGRDDVMFMQTRPKNGITMSFYQYAPEDFRDGAAMNWIEPADEEDPDWFDVSNSPLSEIGNGPSGGGPGNDDGRDEPEPGNGPISAIVFELGERADEKED